MKWYFDLKIGTRLISAFMAVVAIAAVMGYLGIADMGKIANLAASSYANETLGVSYLKEANIDLIYIDRDEKSLLLANTPEEREKFKTSIRSNEVLLEQNISKARPLIRNDEGQALLAKFDAAWNDRKQVLDKIVDMAARDRFEAKRESVTLSAGLGRQKADVADDLLTSLANQKSDLAKAAAQTTQQTYATTRNLMIVMTLGGVLLGLVLGMLTSRSITKPLTELSDAARQIALGNVTKNIEYQSKDEVGSLADSFRALILNIKAMAADAVLLAQSSSDGKLSVRGDASRLQGDYRNIIEGVNHTLDSVVDPLKVTAQNASALASAGEELTAVSQQMAGNAEETATQANVVSAASEQVSRNVASVASASEQMQASIREIAKNANESARVAKNAVGVAHLTNQTVTKLGESSTEIGNVIKVITSIAQQTNLLALNATIEAARAGEAGKGFAVVANEVKELAKQTANATEDIGRKVEAIQGDTQDAVKAIEEIGTIINQINDISNSIATAVEEQTVTTNEIGRSVTEAAKGVDDIAKNIGGVALAARNTTQGANDTQKAAQELSQMAARLQTVVAKFTF